MYPPSTHKNCIFQRNFSTLLRLLVLYVEGLGTLCQLWTAKDPLPSNKRAAAAEILRRTLRFIDSPKMPLMVVCKIPEPPGEANGEVMSEAGRDSFWINIWINRANLEWCLFGLL